MNRGSWRRAAAIGVVIAAWTVGQAALAHRAVAAFAHQDELLRARLLTGHPNYPLAPPMAPHMSMWLNPAWESGLALLCCAVISAALVVGGRRGWSVLPAAFPAAALVGGLADGNVVGMAWSEQPGPRTRDWLLAGVVVDTVTVLVIAAILVSMFPRRSTARPRVPALPALLRTVPVAVVAFGWWLVGHTSPDAADRILVVRTLLLVAAAAVLATSRLPLAATLAVLAVLPFVDPTLTDGSLFGYRSRLAYLEPVAIALCTAAYVGGLPWLLDRLRRSRPSAQPT